MPDPAPLEYQRVTSRPRRTFGILTWLVLPVVVVLLLYSAGSLTSSSNARAVANRARCANNLRQIGLACMMYCNDSQGQYPGEVGLLVSDKYLRAEVFVCPASGDTRLPAATTRPGSALLAGGHCSFVYVGAGKSSATEAGAVVAFDLPDNHAREGGNVLYGDGSVSWERFERLVQLVPELEAGHNSPRFQTLTRGEADAMYQQRWAPKLQQMKNGAWAARLLRVATRPSEGE